jgi:hypothetical protein
MVEILPQLAGARQKALSVPWWPLDGSEEY